MAPALQMPLLRFPLDRGKAFIRHYADSSEKGTTSGQMTILRTPAKAEVLLFVIAPPLPKKSTSALTREKLSLCSVFHGSLDYLVAISPFS